MSECEHVIRDLGYGFVKRYKTMLIDDGQDFVPLIFNNVEKAVTDRILNEIELLSASFDEKYVYLFSEMLQSRIRRDLVSQ